MSKTISIEGGIYFDTDTCLSALGWSEYTFQRGAFDPDWTGGSGSYIPVMPYTLVIEVPDEFDPRNAQIDLLKEKKQRVMAEFQATLTAIERRISELQAIEYTEAA